MSKNTYTHEVRLTNFHATADKRNGTSPYAASFDVISRHHSVDAAERSVRAHRSPAWPGRAWVSLSKISRRQCTCTSKISRRLCTCTCGCAVVVDLAEEARETAKLARYNAELAANIEG